MVLGVDCFEGVLMADGL